MTPPIRVGVLGAAAITPAALIHPAADRDDVEIVAVAARDPERAQTFAAEHGIARVHRDYQELVSDPEVDAVYNPLPNGLHGRWTVAALEAGKHVLCEKPFAANADEAAEVADVARRSGLVVMEAFHYRYHALTTVMLDVLATAKLGRVRRIDAWFRGRLGSASDIRWQDELAAGAMMDIGCYPAHLLRTLAGAEPEVTRAEALERSPGVDRRLYAEVGFDDGRVGSVSGSMLSRRPRASGVRVQGTRGQMTAEGVFAPHAGNRLTLTVDGRTRRRQVPRFPTTYAAQLDAFSRAVVEQAPFPTGVDDAVANMRFIDACYRAAGLEPRQPS